MRLYLQLSKSCELKKFSLSQIKEIETKYPKQLAVGIKIEMEHTTDPATAKIIAVGHIKENNKYYTKLLRSGLVDEDSALAEAKKQGLVKSLLFKARKAEYTDSLGRTWKWNGTKYVYQRKTSEKEKADDDKHVSNTMKLLSNIKEKSPRKGDDFIDLYDSLIKGGLARWEGRDLKLTEKGERQLAAYSVMGGLNKEKSSIHREVMYHHTDLYGALGIITSGKLKSGYLNEHKRLSFTDDLNYADIGDRMPSLGEFSFLFSKEKLDKKYDLKVGDLNTEKGEYTLNEKSIPIKDIIDKVLIRIDFTKLDKSDKEDYTSLISILDAKHIPYSVQLKKSGTQGHWKLQGKIDFQGLSIAIENKKGTYREGTDPNGHEWKTFMNYDYGYVRLTEGVDGDAVDCYVGPHKDSRRVFVIHQNNPYAGGLYDEDKCMIGFDNPREAKRAYLKQYDRRGFFGGMEEFDISEFAKNVKIKKITGIRL